jgi:hypothetical protein
MRDSKLSFINFLEKNQYLEFYAGTLHDTDKDGYYSTTATIEAIKTNGEDIITFQVHSSVSVESRINRICKACDYTRVNDQLIKNQ